MKPLKKMMLLLIALAAATIEAPAMTTAMVGTLPAVAMIDGADAPAAAITPFVATQEQGAAGLPERAQQPRTLRAYWHVFIAFAVTWLLVFGYALTIGRRFGRLEEELRRAGGTAPPPSR